MEGYVHGVSTRKVDDLVAALGASSGISKSEVSRICTGLDAEMAAYRARPLSHVEFPYVFLDATYRKYRVGARWCPGRWWGNRGEHERRAGGARLRRGRQRGRSVLERVPARPCSRGLTGVRLVISDHHLGLKKAIATVMIGAAWQRCRVLFMLARDPRANAEMVAAVIRTIFAQPDALAVAEQFDRSWPRSPASSPRSWPCLAMPEWTCLQRLSAGAMAQGVVDQPAGTAAPSEAPL